MTYQTARTTALALGAIAALALAGCSPSDDGVAEDGNIETVVETANFGDPMYEDMTDMPADDGSYDMNMSAAPDGTAPAEPAPAPTTTSGALLGDDTLDHAAATGMTSRVDRGSAAGGTTATPPAPAE